VKHKSTKPGLQKSYQKLFQENLLLEEQVKKLIKTEYALYNTQIELDKQINLYRSLYDIGRRLSTTLEITIVFAEIENFIINQLNYGGFILLERSEAIFSLTHHGGCCKNKVNFKKPVTLNWIRRLLNSIKDDNGNYLFFNSAAGNCQVTKLCRATGFLEFAIFEFIIGQSRKPSYILIVGNPEQSEFYSKIVLNDMRMIGLGNLVSLVVNAMNNITHYRQLVAERQLLKMKVDERTQDLNNALKTLKKLNKKLNYLSFKDELTGLYNRRGFFTVGEQCFKRAKRNGTNLLLLYCDMDKLKIINDWYGHKEGDFAIRQLAHIFRKVFRDTDIVCRFGGDEFIILIENSSTNSYHKIRMRLEETLIEYNSQSQKKYKISISLGCYTYQGNEPKGLTFNELIEKADEKMYEEKLKKKKEDK
jgi:diguanylate cyclase (GGDEF)-like protein